MGKILVHTQAFSAQSLMSDIALDCRAEVAQLAEHSPEKAGVRSSILRLGTISIRKSWNSSHEMISLELSSSTLVNTMNMVTPLLFSTRLAYIFVFLSFIGSGSFLTAEDDIQPVSSPKTRTVVADVLEVEGDFHIVRGERGEIRIEVTPDTQVTEKFTFGDRIKAVLLPNDVALMYHSSSSLMKPIGITANEPSEPTTNSPCCNKATDKTSERI